MVDTGARANCFGANVEADIPIDNKKKDRDAMEPSVPSGGHPRMRLTFQVQKNG